MLNQTIYPYLNYAAVSLLPTKVIHRPRQPWSSELNETKFTWSRLDWCEHEGEDTRSARENNPGLLRIIEKSCTTALEFYRGHALKSASWRAMFRNYFIVYRMQRCESRISLFVRQDVRMACSVFTCDSVSKSDWLVAMFLTALSFPVLRREGGKMKRKYRK